MRRWRRWKFVQCESRSFTIFSIYQNFGLTKAPKKYPNFADRVHEALTDIFGESGKKIVTHHAEDGSGVGSAIIAGASLQYLFCVDAKTNFSFSFFLAMTKARKDSGFFVEY